MSSEFDHNDEIGNIPIPNNFKYKDVFIKGKPQHDTFDEFYAKHPFMDIGKRAKIFAPFDALKGFNESVSEKEVLYENKIILDDEKKDELNRKLLILRNLTLNRCMAQTNNVIITVTYFVPCTDKNNEAYGYRVQYITIEGICLSVDSIISKTLTVDTTIIQLDDISNITSNDERLINTEW